MPPPSPHTPTPPPGDPAAPARAGASLDGLRIGDAFGSQFFVPDRRRHRAARTLPPAPWSWTDDTEMACTVLGVLAAGGGVIDQDALIDGFLRDYDPYRGYGPGTVELLRDIREGVPWPEAATSSFGGTGSWGNGAAMRVGPIGAWYAGEPGAAARQAAASAVVTHTHPEGVAGAVAVAVAASLAAVRGAPRGKSRAGEGPERASAAEAGRFLGEVAAHLPHGRVRHGVVAARDLAAAGVRSVSMAVRELGNGRMAAAHDTVPFALWAAALHPDDPPGAVWAAVEAGGDMDTTAAVIGSVVCAAPGRAFPETWRGAAEPLPARASATGGSAA